MIQTSELPGSGELHFSIGHRFGDIKGGFYDMFGLDLATIRLGFDYGINDFLSAGIGRSSFEKSYDIYTKLAIVRQSESGSPLAVTANAAWSVNTLRNFYPADRSGITDRSAMLLQIMVARKQGTFSAQIAPSLLRNNYETRTGGNVTVFATPITANMKLSKRLSLAANYIPVFNQPSFFVSNPLSVGLDIDTGGHQFQLIFSNSTGMFEKAVLLNTAGDWSDGNIYFGFNLVRVFYLK
ncbi:MAG: hypothetical protein IH591_17730 [Bacteroidales bacterium]|nr:hypothetical protein [Bacteroidales bacterium]